MTSSAHIRTSIIIPVYNTATYLPACLDSVLAQNDRSFECIIVDDGSTDGSIEVERAYATQDARIRIIEQPHSRQGAARNRGLSEARGEYVCFMDSDDVIEPTLLEKCVEALSNDSLDFVTFDYAQFRSRPGDSPGLDVFEFGDRREFCAREIASGESFWLEYHPRNLLPPFCWLQFFRRDFLIENHLLFKEGIYYEDCEWILRAYMAAQRIRFLPAALYHYRARRESVSNAPFDKLHAESCLEVHGYLSKLLDTCTKSQAEMVLSSSKVIDYLISRSSEFDPDEELVNRISALGESLLETIWDPSADAARKRFAISTLLHICTATEDWPLEKPAPVIPRRLVPRFAFPDLPLPFEGKAVGIYGLGNVCALLLSGLEPDFEPAAFLATDALPGTLHRGRPVAPISDAGALELEHIVIASTRYLSEMESVARRFAPSAALSTPDVLTTNLLLRHTRDGNLRLSE